MIRSPLPKGSLGKAHACATLALVSALGGCAVYQPQAFAPPAALYADRSVTATAVPVSSAAATLPQNAGRIIEVSETRFSDGVSQQIVLAGDRSAHGANRIDVAFRLQAENDVVSENKVPMSRPSETGIAREMEQLFPGMEMQTVPVLLQNAYGPYGLAAGRRGNGERCIYAWQWIEDGGNTSGVLRNPAFAVFQGPMPVSVRIRLCRANASADQLAAVAGELAIGGVRRTSAPVAARGGDALSAATGGSGAGYDGYQLPRALTEEPLPANDGFVARPARRRAAYHAPPRTRRHARRFYAEPRPEAAVYNQPPQQQPYSPQPYAPQPQQYPPQAAYPVQQPVQQMYAPPVYAPQQQQQQQQQGIKQLDPNLPSQAYRGPAAAAARVPLQQPPGAVQYNAPGQPTVPQAGRLMRDPAPGGQQGI